jgi:hypothetical protein
MHPKVTSSNQSTSPAAERIRLALNLETVALSKIPESTVEKLAEISETKLSRFPRKLTCITDNKTTWGGIYYLGTCHFKVNAKMTHEETVQVFVHEFGHAVHYAICDNKVDAALYQKTVTGIRDENIKRLTGIYWKASQYVPSLKEFNHNLFSRYSLKNYNEYFCENFSSWVISMFLSDFGRAIGRLAEKYALCTPIVAQDNSEPNRVISHLFHKSR